MTCQWNNKGFVCSGNFTNNSNETRASCETDRWHEAIPPPRFALIKELTEFGRSCRLVVCRGVRGNWRDVRGTGDAEGNVREVSDVVCQRSSSDVVSATISPRSPVPVCAADILVIVVGSNVSEVRSIRWSSPIDRRLRMIPSLTFLATSPRGTFDRIEDRIESKYQILESQGIGERERTDLE